MYGLIEFIEDERTMSNPNVKRLKVDVVDDIENVSEKLDKCRLDGINAYAIINGVEVDNFDGKDFVGITNQYYEKIEQLNANGQGTKMKK